MIGSVWGCSVSLIRNYGNVDASSYFNEFSQESGASDSINYEIICKIKHFYRAFISLKCVTYLLEVNLSVRPSIFI